MMSRGGEAGRTGATLDLIAPFIPTIRPLHAGRPLHSYQIDYFVREVNFIVTTSPYMACIHLIGITVQV